MSWLKIPPVFIQLTQNILTNWSCHIITPYGPTNSISILDGIPQDETISPLWWTIFYDPLLTKLSNQKNRPYNLANNLAFMDDLNLIAKNHYEIQNLLNITSQFLSINNITIHPKKTKLITINPNKTNVNNTIILNNFNSSLTHPHSQSSITPLPKNKSIRILGIYLSKHSILKPGREKLKIILQSLLNPSSPNTQLVLLPPIYITKCSFYVSNIISKPSSLPPINLQHSKE